MTKKALIAKEVVAHMKAVKPSINEERTIKALIKGMTTRELEAALRGYES